MSTAFLIREDRGHWVGEVASAVHAAGLRAVLVAPPLSPDERAELASVVDDVVAVDNVYEPDAVAACSSRKDSTSLCGSSGSMRFRFARSARRRLNPG